jgi:hypothetical protein
MKVLQGVSRTDRDDLASETRSKYNACIAASGYHSPATFHKDDKAPEATWPGDSGSLNGEYAVSAAGGLVGVANSRPGFVGPIGFHTAGNALQFIETSGKTGDLATSRQRRELYSGCAIGWADFVPTW